MIKRANLDRSRIAIFSDDEQYRYSLLVRWDDTKPCVANIGLNPSTATEAVNDATISRDLTRAVALGFGSFLKLNLFAYRSKSPAIMKLATDPFGDWRDPHHLFKTATDHKATMIIAAWGNHGMHLGRSMELRAAALRMSVPLHKYGINKTGEPVHPLYEPYSLLPTPYAFNI